MDNTEMRRQLADKHLSFLAFKYLKVKHRYRIFGDIITFDSYPVFFEVSVFFSIFLFCYS